MGEERVVIVGAGFGGLRLARLLRRAPVEVTLLDRVNYHTFQPLLYQVATAVLDPEEIAHSVRGILHGQRNATFRLQEVTGVDWDRHELLGEAAGDVVPFDVLVVAAGATTNFFGVEGVEEHALPLKTLTDAVRLRTHVIRRFERADTDASRLDDGELTFVIVGGGPTGVEMAGAFVELFQMVLRKDFPRLDIGRARVVLVEATDHLLPPFQERSRKRALDTLRSRGVEVRLEESIRSAGATSVTLSGGEVLLTHTVVWTAGVRAVPLADRLGLQQTSGGRVVVADDLSVPGHDGVYVIGDMAASRYPGGQLHPQVAQLALQGAAHVVEQLKRRHKRLSPTPFVYRDKGTMATIGRNAAVAELPHGVRLHGRPAWLAWLLLHLVYLIGFRNRLSVLVDWSWNYVTYDRSARLILELPRERG